MSDIGRKPVFDIYVNDPLGLKKHCSYIAHGIASALARFGWTLVNVTDRMSLCYSTSNTLTGYVRCVCVEYNVGVYGYVWRNV